MSDIFTDVENKAINKLNTNISNAEILENLYSLAIGSGDTCFKIDANGQWMGANTFANAPYKVSMSGVLYAVGAVLTGYATESNALLRNDITQILGGIINVGNGNLIIDGTSNGPRITMADDLSTFLLLGKY